MLVASPPVPLGYPASIPECEERKLWCYIEVVFVKFFSLNIVKQGTLGLVLRVAYGATSLSDIQKKMSPAASAESLFSSVKDKFLGRSPYLRPSR